jgi:exportin-7
MLVGMANTSNNATNAAALRNAVPAATVAGLFRDLTGIARATSNRRTYCESCS